MEGGSGKVNKLFQTWKGLPVLRDGDKIRKCNKF